MPILTTSVILSSARAAPRTVADLLRKPPHLFENCGDGRHDVLAVDDGGPARSVAQGDVEDGTPLREVDLFAGKHLCPPRLDIGSAGEVGEEAHRLLRHAVLRIVEEKIVVPQVETLETLRVVCEQIAQMQAAHALGVFVEGLPCPRPGDCRHELSLRQHICLLHAVRLPITAAPSSAGPTAARKGANSSRPRP